MSEEGQRVLRRRAALFASLPKVEAFQALREVAGEELVKRQKLLLVRMGGDEPVDAIQRHAIFDRGFAAGVYFLTEGVIGGADRLLARVEADPGEQIEAADYWSYERTDDE